jgi:guanidinopropionase
MAADLPENPLTVAQEKSVIRRLAEARPAQFLQGETLVNVPRGLDAEGLDIALFGLPFDGGATAQKGAALGPEQIRHRSFNIATTNLSTRITPKAHCKIRDIGDSPLDMFDPVQSLSLMSAYCKNVCSTGAFPLAAGGDHTIALPMLRGVASSHGPVAVIHFDAHTDVHDEINGNRYNHATPFRRAVEEGVEDPLRHIMIGIRGTAFEDLDAYEWPERQGMTVLDIDKCFELGSKGIIKTVRDIIGDSPVYISLDVDALDPADMPGTGWPEPGGIRMRDMQTILRGFRGMNVVGADVNEVIPPLDRSGYTALNAAHLMFEILCVMAEGRAARR